MMKLSPLLPFQSDETPLSWTTRMAAFHSRQRVAPFLRDLKIRLTDLNHGRTSAINRLCEITGEDPTPVFRNTASSDGRLRFILRGEPLPATMLLREETRFCPLCLAEDDRKHRNPGIARRGRLSWCLRIMTTCPTHNLPLISRKRGIWDDVAHELSVLVPETTTELHRLADTLPSGPPSGLQDYVLRRLDGEMSTAWLDDQTLEQVVKATEILGITMLQGTSCRFAALDRETWEVAARKGWLFTSHGEDGVRDALTRLLGDAFARDKGGQNYAAVFGRLDRWLAERGHRTDHGPIKEIVRQFIIDNLDVVEGWNLLGRPVERRKKYSIRSLALETRLNDQTLRNLLVAKGLIDSSSANKSCSVLTIDAAVGRAVVEELRASVELTEAARLLSANRHTINCLIEAGRLTPLHEGRGRSGRVSCRVGREELQLLLKRLEHRAPVLENIPEPWVTPTQATKRARITMQELLDLILEGKLRLVGRSDDSAGFSGIRLDVDDIRTLMHPAA